MEPVVGVDVAKDSSVAQAEPYGKTVVIVHGKNGFEPFVEKLGMLQAETGLAPVAVVQLVLRHREDASRGRSMQDHMQMFISFLRRNVNFCFMKKLISLNMSNY